MISSYGNPAPRVGLIAGAMGEPKPGTNKITVRTHTRAKPKPKKKAGKK